MIASPIDLNEVLAYYKQPPSIVAKHHVSGRPLPRFGDVGTGGVKWLFFNEESRGYKEILLIKPHGESLKKTLETPYASLMENIQTGFGRTFSRLPVVFGVSRQTLYNWLSGETPKEKHQGKLIQLANAADVFVREGFVPTPSTLSRTVLNNKSLLELLRDGANGGEMAEKLIRISKKGDEAKARVKTLLQGRNSTLDDVVIGLPSFPTES